MVQELSFVEPPYRHQPGVTARPSGGMVETVAHAAGAASTLDAVDVQQAWRYGLFLIDHGFFWEAHEVLEPVWMLALPNSRERHLVQGLIQLANACLKFEMGRANAAKRLVDIAYDHLCNVIDGEPVLGMDVAACRREIEIVRERIEDAAPRLGSLQLHTMIG